MSYQPIPAHAEDDTFSPGEKGIYMLGVRRDSDAPPVVDGRLTGLTMDEEGRLKTSNKTATFPLTTGAVVTSGAVLVTDVRRASNVVFHVKNTGTASVTAGAFVFEASVDSTTGSDGTWFTIQAVRSNVNTIDTVTPALTSLTTASPSLAWSWEASVNAYQFMRIRCSTTVAPASTAVTTWTIQRGSYATEPIPASQVTGTQPISGSLTSAGTVTPVSATTVYNIATAATTNAAFIKASAGNLYEITISNPTATPAYVKLYNKTTAPTVGTDIPVLTIPVSATGVDSGFVNVAFGTIGKRFLTGIAIAVTAAAPATDTAAAVAGIQIHATYI